MRVVKRTLKPMADVEPWAKGFVEGRADAQKAQAEEEIALSNRIRSLRGQVAHIRRAMMEQASIAVKYGVECDAPSTQTYARFIDAREKASQLCDGGITARVTATLKKEDRSGGGNT